MDHIFQVKYKNISILSNIASTWNYFRILEMIQQNYDKKILIYFSLLNNAYVFFPSYFQSVSSVSNYLNIQIKLLLWVSKMSN